VGDVVFGFRLKRALGQGAVARIYLAEQDHLAGRPVVLKISAIEGTEPQTLAQLPHTNIVPIYSVHEDPRAGLQPRSRSPFRPRARDELRSAEKKSAPPPDERRQMTHNLERGLAQRRCGAGCHPLPQRHPGC
jgi:hypothetical protein